MKMTFDEEMEKFWKPLNKRQRQLAESDPFYLAATKKRDTTKAQELACEKICDKKVMRQFVEERTWEEVQLEIFS